MPHFAEARRPDLPTSSRSSAGHCALFRLAMLAFAPMPDATENWNLRYEFEPKRWLHVDIFGPADRGNTSHHSDVPRRDRTGALRCIGDRVACL
jgi:hypothetical protein